MNGYSLGVVPGYLNNLSINRPDRIVRLVATYVRLVGLVQPAVAIGSKFRVQGLP